MCWKSAGMTQIFAADGTFQARRSSWIVTSTTPPDPRPRVTLTSLWATTHAEVLYAQRSSEAASKRAARHWDRRNRPHARRFAGGMRGIAAGQGGAGRRDAHLRCRWSPEPVRPLLLR